MGLDDCLYSDTLGEKINSVERRCLLDLPLKGKIEKHSKIYTHPPSQLMHVHVSSRVLC